MLEAYKVSYNRAYHAYLNGYTVQIYADGQLLDILERRGTTRRRAQFDFRFYVLCATIWHGRLSYNLP